MARFWPMAAVAALPAACEHCTIALAQVRRRSGANVLSDLPLLSVASDQPFFLKAARGVVRERVALPLEQRSPLQKHVQGGTFYRGEGKLMHGS